MASATARRLIGEAEETPPSSSVASEWFASLGDTIKSVLADGSVDDIEINATVLMLPDEHVSPDEFTERPATWEEAQNPAITAKGNWVVVNDAGQPITAYSVYAHRFNKGVEFISDHKTHEEALAEANGLAALLGAKVHDLTPDATAAFNPVEEKDYGSNFVRRLVGKVLK